MAVDVTLANYQTFQLLIRKIEGKLERLFDDDKASSNTETTCENKHFKELVELGPRIIPYLVYRACRYGWHRNYFTLLRSLSGEDVVSETYYGRIAKWLDWFEKSQYNIKDMYFGLIKTP